MATMVLDTVNAAEVSDKELALARRYPMVISWDEEFSIYVVSFPGFPGIHGYGATPEAAAQQGGEIIVHMVTGYIDAGRELPEPLDFAVAQITS
jgi:predicted RNase H-like HicB family nuclease